MDSYKDKKVNKIIGKITSIETGEYLGSLGEGDVILRGASLEGTREWNYGSFFKGHDKEIGLWLKDLSHMERSFILAIVPYVRYESCCLQYRNNGEDIGTEDLINIVGMARSTLYEVINSLLAKDIIYKGKNSTNRQYYVNPWLFCKGNRINKVLKSMFRNYKIRCLNGIKWGNIKNEMELYKKEEC